QHPWYRRPGDAGAPPLLQYRRVEGRRAGAEREAAAAVPQVPGLNRGAAMSDYRTLLVERRGGADWLTLNRPDRLNAFDATMVDELNDYFDRRMTDLACRVVVVRGAGRAFC